MSERCEFLVHRKVENVVEVSFGAGGVPQDYSHWQKCGRPVETDGLCRYHLRKRAQDERWYERMLRRFGL